MRLLITRPQPEAARTAAALCAGGHTPTVAPLFEIETVGQVDIRAKPWSALLLTSAHGVRGLAEPAQRDAAGSMPVFAVGERTAQAAREAGFTTVHCSGGDAADLTALVAARLAPPARLLYLAGADRSGDLEGRLQAQGFAVDLVVAYRAAVVRALPPQAVASLTSGLDGVLHFSRRAVETYLDAARCAGLLTAASLPVHYCMSTRVAEPLRAAGVTRIHIAAEPNEAALLALIERS